MFEVVELNLRLAKASGFPIKNRPVVMNSHDE